MQFKTELVTAYRARMPKMKGYSCLRCQLLGLGLPACLVTAGHIFKYEWLDLVLDWMGFPDIDDVRNGLLLFKPVEYAADHSQLCFIDGICRILDPSIRHLRLLDALAAIPGDYKPEGYTYKEWAAYEPLVAVLGNKTFGDLADLELCAALPEGARQAARGRGRGRLPPLARGNAGGRGGGRRASLLVVKPYKRCLWFHAHLSVAYAKEKWGYVPDEEVPDFYSTDFCQGPREKVVEWLVQVQASSA